MTIGVNWKPIWMPVWKQVWQQASPPPPVIHHATDSGHPIKRKPKDEEDEILAIASIFT